MSDKYGLQTRIHNSICEYNFNIEKIETIYKCFKGENKNNSVIFRACSSWIIRFEFYFKRVKVNDVEIFEGLDFYLERYLQRLS